MIDKIKSRLIAHFWGPDYLTDERIQAGADKAGNYCFFLTMFLLWLALLWGILFDQIELVIIPFIIFLISCIFYIIFRVKNGSFQPTFKKAQTKPWAILKWSFLGAIFASLAFLFNLKNIETFTSANILHLVIKCAIDAMIWVFLLIFFTRFLIRKNDNALKKKMDDTD